MKYYKLDKEEQKTLDSFERGVFKGVGNKAQEKSKYMSYAHASLHKTRNINIRLSERDLQKLKVKAAEKGIPYQTLVASVLHQYGSQT